MIFIKQGLNTMNGDGRSSWEEVAASPWRDRWDKGKVSACGGIELIVKGESEKRMEEVWLK